MKFFNKVRERLRGEEVKALDQESFRRAERLAAIVDGGAFDVFIEEILDPMEADAFEAFKRIPPDETLQIMQAQKVAQVVDQIKKRVFTAIEEGRAAKARLLDADQSEEN